jgi:glyoxylase-like metal-dependent hydrolase (beta-lactamase superfamily II)
MREPDRPLGPHVTLLGGRLGGKYPEGRPLLVRGSEETVVIDPSLALVGRPGGAPAADRVLNSHCHEDHVAGNHLYPDATWHLPDADLGGIRSLDGLMAIYGFAGKEAADWARAVVERFHFTPSADARGFADGEVYDLGGVQIQTIHAPGHTRGHSLFHVQPDDVLYLGDIDLSSFGPYYGDAWSSLEDFERSLTMARNIAARCYATFHHVGVLEDRGAFVERLDRFAAVVGRREAALLGFLVEPRAMAEIVAHRFVYRPQDAVAYADAVERRSMSQHLARLIAAGRVEEVEPERYLARTAA